MSLMGSDEGVVSFLLCQHTEEMLPDFFGGHLVCFAVIADAFKNEPTQSALLRILHKTLPD